jgi:hypothetical protein
MKIWLPSKAQWIVLFIMLFLFTFLNAIVGAEGLWRMVLGGLVMIGGVSILRILEVRRHSS